MLAPNSCWKKTKTKTGERLWQIPLSGPGSQEQLSPLPRCLWEPVSSLRTCGMMSFDLSLHCLEQRAAYKGPFKVRSNHGAQAWLVSAGPSLLQVGLQEGERHCVSR